MVTGLVNALLLEKVFSDKYGVEMQSFHVKWVVRN